MRKQDIKTRDWRGLHNALHYASSMRDTLCVLWLSSTQSTP